MANHLKTGEIGEGIGCIFLEEKGFDVLKRNYRKKWGELDIIAKYRKTLHFVEVKTVSCEISDSKVPHETDQKQFQPEYNVNIQKRRRLARVIQSYLSEKSVPHETEWQFDILAVFLDTKRKTARVRWTKNIPLF